MGNDSSSGQPPAPLPAGAIERALAARPVETETTVEHAQPPPKPPQAPEPPAFPIGPEALKQLTTYNEAIINRFAEVKKIFDGNGKAIDPTTNGDFRGFVQANLSLVNMRYVLFGQFNSSMEESDPLDRTAEALRKQGFAVSGESPQEKVALDKLDPALAGSPAARLAVAAGFKPDGDDDDDAPQSAPLAAE